jgi:hypothetical protein
MPNPVKFSEGSKFMWNGRVYKSEEEAREAEEGYKKEGFETLLDREGSDYLVYTRRVVTEIVLEGEAIV